MVSIKMRKISLFLIIINLLVTIFSFVIVKLRSSESQIGDADVYFNESLLIDKGIFHEYFLNLHNYGYPTFLSVLRIFGIESRFEVGVLQHSMLLFSVGLLSSVISKNRTQFLYTLTLLNFSIFIPNGIAYSSNTLTESLVSTIYILTIVLTYLLILNLKSLNDGKIIVSQNVIYIFLIAMFSGVIMMLRPAYIWVPVIFFVIIMSLFLRQKINFIFTIFVLPIIFVVGVVIVFIPEMWISNLLGGNLSNSVFSLGMAKANTQYAYYTWTFFTNMTGCGPLGWDLSPYFEWPTTYGDFVQTSPKLSLFDKFAALSMHLVNMIDPRPGPTYNFSLTGNHWYPLTIINAIIIFLTVAYLFFYLRNFRNPRIQNKEFFFTNVLLVLSSLFMAVRIHGEYRFGQFLFISMAIFCAFMFNNSDYKYQFKKNTKVIVFLFAIQLIVLIILKEQVLNSSDYLSSCMSSFAS